MRKCRTWDTPNTHDVQVLGRQSSGERFYEQWSEKRVGVLHNPRRMAAMPAGFRPIGVRLLTNRPKTVNGTPSQMRRAGLLGRRLNQHRHSAFIGNFATLFSGKAGAFAISFLAISIIARPFDPADFGVAAFLLAVVGVLGIIATLRYDLALVLIENPGYCADNRLSAKGNQKDNRVRRLNL